jgi:tetratricopeptide (TPR) repeat protein
LYWKWIALAGALGALTWIIVTLRVPSRPPADFPQLPDLEAQNPALRELLVNADRAARRAPNSPDDVGRLGMIYHANQLYDNAEKAYRIAARLNRSDYRWAYLYALVLEETGRDSEVQAQLTTSVRLRPDYVPALQKLGDICYKADRLECAARYYERSASAGESAVPGTFGLARIAARRKDWTKVVDLVEPLAAGTARIRPVHQILLDAHEALGQAEKADDDSRALMEPSLIAVPPPHDPLAGDLLALSWSSTRLLKEAGLFSRFHQPDDAIRIARRAVEVAPTDPDAHHFLARTLLEAHGEDPVSVTQALGHLTEGLRLRTDDPLPLWYFATTFFKKKKTDEAVERLRSMVAARSGSADAQYYLGLIADRQGRSAEAAGHYHASLKLNPSNAEACHRLGLLNVADERIAEAISWFRKAVSLKPDFTVARCNLGVALDVQGNTGQAIGQFREALLRKPNDAMTHRFLAIALLRTGKTAEAVRHFSDAVRFAPDDSEAHYGLGCALIVQGRSEEAARQFKEALRLQPGYTDAVDRLRELELSAR